MADEIIGKGSANYTDSNLATPAGTSVITTPEEQAIADTRNEGQEKLKEERTTKEWANTENDLTKQILGIWKTNGLLNSGNAPKRGKMSAFEVESAARLAAVNMLASGGKTKELLGDYVKELSQPVMPLVIDLLGDMIQRVPLSSIAEIKDCGFFTERAFKGTSKDIWVLKAVCGWMQAGEDPKKMWSGNNLKDADEVEVLIRGIADENNRERRWSLSRVDVNTMATNLEKAVRAVEGNVLDKDTRKALNEVADKILNTLGVSPKEEAADILKKSLLSPEKMIREVRSIGAYKYLSEIYKSINER